MEDLMIPKERIRERGKLFYYVVLVEVLQHSFPLGEDELSAEVLSVVPAPFPKKSLSVACKSTQVQHNG